MYGRGNYAPPRGQGPFTSNPALHQHPPASAFPPFSQGSQPPRPTMIHSGPLPVPSQVVQPGHPVYQHAPPRPPRLVLPPLVPSSGINAQRYLNSQPPPPPPPPLPPPPPPQVHGSSQMQQHSQWSQNSHFIAPPVPSLAPRVLPSPLPQGQTLYGGQLPQPPAGGMQAPSPPLPSSGLYVSPSVGSYGHSVHQQSNMPATGPPPPPPPPLPPSPPGSPPLPPSSPPPTSSSPFSKIRMSRLIPAVSESFCQPDVGSNVNRGMGIDESTSDCVGGVLNSCLIGDKVSKADGAWKCDGETGSNMGLPERPSAGSSSQVNIMTSHGSSDDSDMDMEDDITHPDEEPWIYSFNNQSHETLKVLNELDANNQSQASQSTTEDILAKDENVVHSGSSGLKEQRHGSETSSDQNQSPLRKSCAEDGGLLLDSSIAVKLPSGSNVHKFSPQLEDSTPQNASTDLAGSRLGKLPGQLGNGASPFRLLQDYASDGSSDGEAHFGDAIPVTLTPPVGVRRTNLDRDVVDNFETDFGPKSLLESNKELESLRGSYKSHDSSDKPETVTVEAEVTSAKIVQNISSNQESVKYGISHGEHRQDNVSRDDAIVATVDKKEDRKSTSTMLKVDEFGRLIREGVSDSDSGGSQRYSRQRGKRVRSRSRSRSPHDRRRRRSPRRRRERRGRSRSFSPKRRRSRSKSPPYRHGGEFGGDKTRRDKGHLAECFDFLWGKCYRGASCRYLHLEDKSERSRSYQSKQQLQDLPPSSRSSDFREKVETVPHKKVSHQHGEGRIQEMNTLEDMPDLRKKEVLNEPNAHLPNKQGHLKPPAYPISDADKEKLQSGAGHGMPSFKESLEPQRSEKHYSDQIFLSLNVQDEQMDNSSASETSPAKVSVSVLSQIPIDKPLNKDSISQSNICLSSVVKSFPSDNIPSQHKVPQEPIPTAVDHPSHFPPPPFTSLSQETSALYSQQMPRDYNLMFSAADYPSHSSSFENFPAYQSSVTYPHAQLSLPQNTSWNSLAPPPIQHLPPRPPFANDMTGSLAHGQYSSLPIHLQQNMLPPRNDISSQTSARPSITQFSQVSLNQSYPLINEPDRPLHHLDDLQSRTFPLSQPMSQPHGVPEIVGENCFSGRPLPGLYPLNSITQEKLHSQVISFSRESPSSRLQALPAENVAPADAVSSLLGEDGKLGSTLSRYTSDLLDRNLESRLANFGGSRIKKHFNPYASTFEQPLNSKFSSSILVQEKDRLYSSNYGAAYHVPADEKAAGSLGSRNLNSPEISGQAVEGTVPKPGDQYDPLYDSIEPSLNSVRKPESKKSLDAEENKQKLGGAISVMASLDNEEYGETADAEAGAVENESSSNLNDDADETAAGEIEIDQVKAPRKSKKSKDSRSMRLFKIALADFVKEVLKPSWRQGSMSKEAFKTIVKKTVDKVSGAMKSHHLPKSQAKINHYIDSSQRKLTKLVMGYVDKYVKV